MTGVRTGSLAATPILAEPFRAPRCRWSLVLEKEGWAREIFRPAVAPHSGMSNPLKAYLICLLTVPSSVNSIPMTTQNDFCKARVSVAMTAASQAFFVILCVLCR